MMNVIETVPVMEPVWKWIIFAMVVSFVLFCIMSWVVTSYKVYKGKRVIVWILLVCSVVLAAGGIVRMLCERTYVPTGENYVRATFTDDFPFMSVMGRYEIVERNGDEFLLKPVDYNCDIVQNKMS